MSNLERWLVIVIYPVLASKEGNNKLFQPIIYSTSVLIGLVFFGGAEAIFRFFTCYSQRSNVRGLKRAVY